LTQRLAIRQHKANQSRENASHVVVVVVHAKLMGASTERRSREPAIA
jgi:hypothetical protein